MLEMGKHKMKTEPDPHSSAKPEKPLHVGIAILLGQLFVTLPFLLMGPAGCRDSPVLDRHFWGLAMVFFFSSALAGMGDPKGGS
jgi:hypothetical protein